MTYRRRLPLLRLRPIQGPDGEPAAWRVISGKGLMLKTHGTFATREEAVKYVLDVHKAATTPPGETHGATPRLKP